ncbi:MULTISPECIES: MtrAB system histidine kinase MtrB [Cryobacterium]|uniref:Sensor histidine kinase MtrB n=1 Tax=Cryobacterium levicorallinum TaxID=995038 RepID=A0A1I3CK70_9MICO|nr:MULTISPECIES: MtrAB system histidine kinase MtrB [Cryobacterium]TFB88857.1 HAMP domain-containing histidine kinase [Cryobacterium levicorallinum]TFD56045.1 HAMP domain-containing histidine kinase [Cryobacterium sp. Hh38]SFH74581.1 two-component system, OmpR family, sensor histidine kinase MtrB [Cryobacterium levicorallinum]
MPQLTYWSRPRNWPRLLRSSWRSSLQFRTVTISVAFSGLAILVVGVYMSVSIGNDLFQSRLSQVLLDSNRATSAAQSLFDASDATDRVQVQNLLSSARTSISTTSSSRLVAVLRVPGQESSTVAPQDSSTFGQSTGVIGADLRTQVQGNNGEQFWQSVTLTGETATVPGIVVGSQITVPVAGRYELYIAYSLQDAEATLLFVQQTLGVAGVALVLLIGAVTWIVVRFVVTPLRVAAETSQKLASGDLMVRIPEKGEDVIATLARSFNGMADSLQSQIRELADLSEVQQRFVSDVSHELRTPLTTIRLAGDVLYDQRASFPPATGRTAELLHTQVERFELLLSDLLEISRYDAGSVELESEPTNLVYLAEDAIDSLRSLAESKGSDLRLVAPGGYLNADVDPRRIRRVLHNLIGNAIEHGEGKPVMVSVDSDAKAVALAVRDYGLGMSQAEVAHVFDRFWRADPSRQRTIGGTGLGLAISREDASVHNGWLQVWSRPGEGSCFRLTLPRTAQGLLESSPLPLPPADATDQLGESGHVPVLGGGPHA